MADHGVPHFHNDSGVSRIEIGAKRFMCIGATPPFDHPHVFLDMGSDAEIICPYCSTLFSYKASLHGDATVPPGCGWHGNDEADGIKTAGVPLASHKAA
ncbi:MAG: zinc-finger domain-containing protein [Beijerinckiaceae bacterium]